MKSLQKSNIFLNLSQNRASYDFKNILAYLKKWKANLDKTQSKIKQIKNFLQKKTLKLILMSDKKQQVREYLANFVNIWVQPMIYDIVKKRPANPAAHAHQWIQNYINAKKLKSHQLDSEEDEFDEIPFDHSKLQKKKNQPKTRSRIGISEEVFGSFNKKEVPSLKMVPKLHETKLLIQSLIRHSILFQNIDYQDEQTLINAMQQFETTQNQTIIREGQNGDALFIVQSGQYECFKVMNGENKYLKTYQHGDAFGQLSLMYNAPRAATITVKVPGILYSLDRITFSHVVKNAATKKRELYKKVVDSIEILSDLRLEQKEQFYDILKEEKFQDGQYVIKQGETGNKFYIVLQGNLVAQKQQIHDQFPRVVYKYKDGDYFGQLALIHDMNRQASVKAVNRCRVASIDRESFKRMLGSIEDILKRNQGKYQNIQQKIVCT